MFGLPFGSGGGNDSVMPTVEHDASAELFEQRPELALMALKWVGLEVKHCDSVQVSSADFTQIMSTEYRADRVIQALKNKQVVFSAIVEIQRTIKEDKVASWRVYTAVQEAKTNASATVLVVCFDESVEQWARQERLWGGGYPWAPKVLGPSNMPRIEKVSQAKKNPELAVLSAMMHGFDLKHGPKVASAACLAVRTLDDERRRLYTDLVLARTSPQVRTILEQILMQHNYGPQSDIAKEHFALGEQNGLIKGRLVEVRANVRRVLEVRGLKVTKKQSALIDACSDLATLERWHVLAITASSTQELFV